MFIIIKAVEGTRAIVFIDDISCITEKEEVAPIKSYSEIHLKSDVNASFKTYLTIDEILKNLGGKRNE